MSWKMGDCHPCCLTILLTIVLGRLASTSHIRFSSTPSDTVVVYGDDLFLDCQAYIVATGSEEGLQYSWRFHDDDAPAQSSIFINHTLLVPSVTESELGNYTCVVTDDVTGEEVESPPADVFHAFIKMYELSPLPVSALEDDVITMSCITGESAPPPEIAWERNGVVFTGGEQHNATYGGSGEQSQVRQYSMKLIMVAKPYLDGTYNCVSRNPRLGIEVRSLKILMTTTELESPPYLMEEFVITEEVAAFNQPLLLDCPITGKPQVDVQWFKDGVMIQNTQSFLILQNGSIHTPTAQLEDAGLYFCLGLNEYGQETSPNITVTVAVLELDFQQSPEDQYLIAGQPATLHCRPPFSVPPATVTWYKDNKLLIPRSGDLSVAVQRTADNSWNVVFAGVQKIDEGEYFCVANNDLTFPPSRTSRVARLYVGGAPTFLQLPQGLTVTKGSLAQLVCSVTGDPLPAITWLFEDTVIRASETVSFRDRNQEISIGNIHKGNEGTYTCRAENRYGLKQTQVYIKVLVPPVILQPVGNNTASAGDAAIIPCAVYSDPEPSVFWLKDGVAVSLGNRLTQLQDGLYINSVLPMDDGSYVCTASNVAGSVQSTGTLSVQVLPVFEERPASQNVTIGQNASLSCVASGYPTPDVSWLYNGSTLFPTGVLLSLDKHQLFLLNIDWTHVGVYTCRAQNQEGVASASAYIRIHMAPQILQVDGVPLLFKGENLNLHCLATGIPTPSIVWQHNRTTVQPSQDGRITLPGQNSLSVLFVTLADAGTYTCRATNPAGVSQRDVDVYVIARPSPPVLTNIRVVSAESVELHWSLEQMRPQTPVDYVLIYYRQRTEPVLQTYPGQISASLRQFTVGNLQPATHYLFTVSAVNGAGESDISNILGIQTNDAGPSQPRNLEATSVFSTNITVVWEIPFMTNGDIRRYQVHYKQRDAAASVTVFTDSIEVTLDSVGRASESITLSDLDPYTWYTVLVRGATVQDERVLWGNFSEPLEVKTSETAPTGSPRDTEAEPVSPTVVQVIWEAVTQELQNGPIKRYYVSYWLLSDMTLLGQRVVESLDLKVNISDLDPWTWYEFEVVAENDGGQGPKGDRVRARTLPTAPTGSPVDVSASSDSPRSISLVWKAPLLEERNSIISGYIVQYWQTIEEDSVSTVTLQFPALRAHTVGNLTPWTDYSLRVAAFTTQVDSGIGPFSGNITAQTEEDEPGPVSDIQSTSTPTRIQLSWEPPASPNGVVSEYLITYSSTGSLAMDLDARAANLSSAIYNSSQFLSELFMDFSNNITEVDILALVVLCPTYHHDNGTESDLGFSELAQLPGTSEELTAWIEANTTSLQSLCEKFEIFDRERLGNMSAAETVFPSFNLTTESQFATLTGLDPFTNYNLSVRAWTSAGYGEPVFTTVATAPAVPTPGTTPPTAPAVTTSRPTSTTVLVQAARAENQVSVPVVVGGGVAGLFVILLIFVIGACLFCRRRRYEDEKTHVIQEEPADNVYRQLDRNRSSQVAYAAEDGTDTDSRLSVGHVDLYPNAVHYGKSPPRRDYGTAKDQSFMTDQSGRPLGRGSANREAFLGLENPSYGFDPAHTVKTNPAYIEEQGSSDQESMAVSMTLSAEEIYAQGENTLKRKGRMKSSDAAAIARMRNSAQPFGVSERDTSSLINNDTEVIYNERTAL